MGLQTVLGGMVVSVLALAAASPAAATEWFVAAGASGSGTSGAPLGRIQDALDMAQPGDVVTVRTGTYAESIRTVRGGTATAPIAVRAAGARGSVVVTASGRVLRVDHPYILVQGLVLDGQYGLRDTVDVNGGASYLTLRDMEIRRSSRDLVDIVGSPQGIVIEGSLLHHALNAGNGRTDAHGIAAGAVRNMTIRDTEIHTFSGDGFQVDPDRSPPGWTSVTIERSRIWLEPLPAAQNGFAAGVVPGENAVDTKASAGLPRATLVIRDVIASGFRDGLIANMAAFNLKEHIDATLDRVTVYDSEIAFRLRGDGPGSAGAWVAISNAVVHDAGTAFRYEEDIQNLRVWNSTVGAGVSRAFRAAESGAGGLDVRNLLVLGTLPPEASHPSNRGVDSGAFVDAAGHDYALAPGSPAIDAGTTLSGVTMDRAGASRPQGPAFDVGAYERVVPATGAGGDIVIHATSASTIAGSWRLVPDATAAGGTRLWHPDAGAAFAVAVSPVHYFEMRAWVDAATPYRLWMRGAAEDDHRRNDSVSVQFSGSVTRKGKPLYRIGTTSATRIVLQDCSGCPLAGWGWQDTKSGLNVLGPLVTFSHTGFQTIRVQTREDGMSIDQIALSPSTYLSDAPGPPRNDATILPEQ
jgi:hypothetical protein